MDADNPRRILLTGATGYIGKHLLRKLLSAGHHVTCCVRDPSRFKIPEGFEEQVDIVEVDFVEMPEDLRLEQKVDAAYYLIHSMSASTGDFKAMETTAAENFLRFTEKAHPEQIIYLSGIINEDELSPHLDSRHQVEQILKSGHSRLTTLRAGIIVGAGSASFELIRDLVEKLPLMIAPKWLLTRCQPIAVENVMDFLTGVLLRPTYYDKSYDIGSEDILTYKEMLKGYAEVRGLKRYFITVPVMTPRLSSYWLYFVTSVSYKLAVNLVDSMKVEVICEPNDLAEELGISLLSYQEALKRTLHTYKSGTIISSWKDALSSSYQGTNLNRFHKVPEYGVLRDQREVEVTGNREAVIANIWSIGGKRGWYYGTWLWRIRGLLDKMVGGVGLRRGRTHAEKLEAGDALDFWRVLRARRSDGHLLLFAEMKLPGEAWLEFRLVRDGEKEMLRQTATFRPKGLWGRMYWYLVAPFHFFVFQGMINGIRKFRAPKRKIA